MVILIAAKIYPPGRGGGGALERGGGPVGLNMVVPLQRNVLVWSTPTSPHPQEWFGLTDLKEPRLWIPPPAAMEMVVEMNRQKLTHIIKNVHIKNKIQNKTLCLSGTTLSKTGWKEALPTPAQLLSKGFSKSTKHHSFTQSAAFETITFFVLKSDYLGAHVTAGLWVTHPLLNHMATMIPYYQNYDLTWLKNPQPQWTSQEKISAEKAKACMACLFHYDINVSLVMEYLGGNYTGEHRNVEAIIQQIKSHVSPYLLDHFRRVMTTRCPNIVM